MPSDFLRDVLRTNDAARPAPRRWPLFPLSLVVHAVGAMAYLVIPLAADVTPPTPRPLHADRRVLIRVLPPAASRHRDCRSPQRAPGQAHRPPHDDGDAAAVVPFTLPGLPGGGSADTAVGFSVDKPSVPASLGSGSSSTEKSDLSARTGGRDHAGAGGRQHPRATTPLGHGANLSTDRPIGARARAGRG